MKKIIILILSLITFGCASTSTDVSSVKTTLESNSLTINDSVLLKNSSYVVLDELEGLVYYSANDWNSSLLGDAYSKIYFTYHPKEKVFFAEFRSLSIDWIHSKWISVYIDKSKLISESPGILRRTTVNQVPSGAGLDHIYTHEWYKFSLTIEQAEKIANSNPKLITFRFGGGPAGYVDQKVAGNSSFVGLKAVVELAKSTTEM